MNENNLESMRRDLITLIDKTEDVLKIIDSMGSDINQEATEAEPLKWLDFKIVVDRYQNSSNALCDRCRDLRQD